MLFYLLFAGILGGLGWVVQERAEKTTVRLYAKIASIALFSLSVFFLYLFIYYYDIGANLASFGAGGQGIAYFNNATNTSYTFFSSTDSRTGEYFALQKSNSDVITLFAQYLPYMALVLAGYLLWYYVETALFQRGKDRMT